MCLPPLSPERDTKETGPIQKNHAIDEQQQSPDHQTDKTNAHTKNGTSFHTEAHRNLTTVTTLASLSLFLLVTSFTLTLPHLQSRRELLLCDALCQGSLTSLRSTLGLIGAALMGRLSDSPRVGRRVCLYVGSCAALASLVLGIGVTDQSGLFWSLVPGALLQQNFSVWKAVLADYAAALEDGTSDGGDVAALRAGSVGKLGMSAGLAFMVGPLVGATVVKTYERASYVAIVFVLLSVFFIARIPAENNATNLSSKNDINTSATEQNETLNPKIAATNEKVASPTSSLQFLNLTSSITPSALYLILIRTLMALAFHIYNTIWTASLKTRFDFGPREHGQFMSFAGLMYALSQGYIARRVLTSLTQRGRIFALQLCCVALGVGRVVAFLLTDVISVYAAFGCIIIALGLINTVLTADASRLAPSSEIGGLYGILDAAQSAAGMVGPVLGGALAGIESLGGGDGVSVPLGTVAGLYGVVFVMVTFGYERLVLGVDCGAGKGDSVGGDVLEVGGEKKKNT